jgi:hypothetical protein
MPTIEEDKRELIMLQNQLTVFNLFEKDLSLQSKEREIATDAILDKMIVLLKRIRKHEESKKGE